MCSFENLNIYLRLENGEWNFILVQIRECNSGAEPLHDSKIRLQNEKLNLAQSSDLRTVKNKNHFTTQGKCRHRHTSQRWNF